MIHPLGEGRAARLGLVALGAVLFLFSVFPRDAWLLDDALIYQNFVRSFAEGRGLTYGPGAVVEGFSSPLWMLCLLALHGVGLGGYLCAKAFGALLGLGTVVLYALMPLSGASLWKRAGVVAMLALMPSLSWWSASGLDTALVFFLVALALFAVARDLRWLVALACSMLLLSRPEGLLLAAPFCVLLLRRESEKKRQAALLLAVVGPWILWEIFRIHTYGELLSGSALAKVGPEPYTTFHTPRSDSILYVLKSVVFLGVPWLGVAGAAWWAARSREGREQPLLLCALGVVGADLLFVLLAKADWMPFARFLLHVIPAMMVLLEAVVVRYPKLAAGLISLGLLVDVRENLLDFQPAAASRSGQPLLASFSPERRPFRDPLPTDFSGYYQPYFLIRYTRPGDRVLISDVGQAGYLAHDVVLLDQMGLVSSTERRFLAGKLSREQMIEHFRADLPALVFFIHDPKTAHSAMKVAAPLEDLMPERYTHVHSSSWWSGQWQMHVWVRNDRLSIPLDSERFQRWLRGAPGVDFPVHRLIP